MRNLFPCLLDVDASDGVDSVCGFYTMFTYSTVTFREWQTVNIYK